MVNTYVPEITKEPFKNQAAGYIRDLILNNILLPGDRIVPGKIAADLKIGRGAIREALMILESEGLVKNVPYSGSFVARCDPSELEEICSVRIMLEFYAVKNQYDRITEEDYKELKRFCDLMQAYVEEHKPAEVLKYDALFHGYFVKKESRSILYEAWDISTVKMSVLFFSLTNAGYSLDQTAEHHYRLLDMLHSSLSDYMELLYEHYMKVSRYQACNR